MSHTARLLITRRLALGVTQRDVAEVAKITTSAVSRWESGNCFIPASRIKLVGEYLGCLEELGVAMTRDYQNKLLRVALERK